MIAPLPPDERDPIRDAETALANLVATYEAIGLALEGAFRFDGEGYRGVLSAIQHGAGNFALVRNPGPRAARELAAIAGERPELFIYLLPSATGDSDAAAAESLRRAGFRLFAVQAVMARPAIPLELHRRSRMVEATGISPRIELMDFLTKQFFEYHPREFRMHLAVATARAEVCRLFEIRDRRLRVAGAMTTELQGAYGLYDLAVRDGYRGAGLGRELLNDLLSNIPERTRLVTLQCLRPLIPWYERAGFAPVGEMATFVRDEG